MQVTFGFGSDGYKTFDSNDLPIMIKFTDDELQLAKRMQSNKFLSYPDTMSEKDAAEFIKI